MEIAYIAAAVLQQIAISLGVGCSTVAITQFFVAIADGKIEESERRIMGLVYVLLRIAMGTILVTSLVLSGIFYQAVGIEAINPFLVGTWVVIFALFLNAFAMTMHWIPSRFGPGIQAGSWYTLGLVFALAPLGLVNFSYAQFALGYAGILILTVGLINGAMNYLKQSKG